MDLVKVKNLLQEEINNRAGTQRVERDDVLILPILHNENFIILQLDGWSINLHRDGTWTWEATEGG